MTTDVLAGFTELDSIPNERKNPPAGVSITYGGQCRFNKAFSKLVESPHTVTVFLNSQETRIAFRFGNDGACGLRTDPSGGLLFNSAPLSRSVLRGEMVRALFPLIEQHGDVFVFSMDPIPGTIVPVMRRRAQGDD